MATERRLLYADSSALVKLVVDEKETEQLQRYLRDDPILATSEIALVEVHRAAVIASPGRDSATDARRRVEACLLIQATRGLLVAAAELTSSRVRALDAIHLAAAKQVDAEEMLVYDRRLAEAARDAGLATAAPGAA